LGTYQSGVGPDWPAYSKIMALADRERARFPHLTKEAAIERVYRSNPELAAAERREAYDSMTVVSVRSLV
jgi:hypothetical protein